MGTTQLRCCHAEYGAECEAQDEPSASPQHILGDPTCGRGSNSGAFKPTARSFMSNLDALSVETWRMHHICAMPEYSALSPEELRHHDYVNGCRGGELSSSRVDEISETGAVVDQTFADEAAENICEASSVLHPAQSQPRDCANAVVATGVICPCCAMLASAARGVFTEDGKPSRQPMLCKVRPRGPMLLWK